MNTIIIFNNGKEVKRFQADISFKMVATRKEIQAEIDTMVGGSGDSQEAMRQAFSSDSARDSIRSSLLSRKVMQRLVEIIEGRRESTKPSGEADPVESEPAQPDSVEAQVAVETGDTSEPEAD